MADLRISTNVAGSSPATALDAGSDRSEAVRAAQRAFFEAAMRGAPHTAAIARAPTASAAPAVAPPPRVDKFEFDPDNPPEQVLRPGSLVDIRV